MVCERRQLLSALYNLIAAPAPDPAAETAARDLVRCLHRMIAKLPPRLRRVTEPGQLASLTSKLEKGKRAFAITIGMDSGPLAQSESSTASGVLCCPKADPSRHVRSITTSDFRFPG